MYYLDGDTCQANTARLNPGTNTGEETARLRREEGAPKYLGEGEPKDSAIDIYDKRRWCSKNILEMANRC